MRLMQPYEVRADVRGVFRGITNAGSWEEINFVETAAGEKRGGHYHKSTTELFYIIDGEIDIEVMSQSAESAKRMRIGAGDIVVIEPGEIHTFICRTHTRWINALSRRMADGEKDFFVADQRKVDKEGDDRSEKMKVGS
jgi:mannose-6-phosphate isomerase-like protein (cupin superfamily)